MSSSDALPFSTIAHALREAGMEISVKDILMGIDALEAIEDPFVYLEPVGEETGALDRNRKAKRDRLVWLIQTLWARSEIEREIVRRTLENDIAPVPALYVLDIAGIGASKQTTSDPSIRPPSTDALKDLSVSDAANQTGQEDEIEETMGSTPALARQQVALNVPVPAIDDETLPDSEPFELRDVAMLDELALASIWRRFRQPVLKTDHHRPDIENSIHATIRAGNRLTIVPAMRRVNKACMIVLLDVSIAMAPWESMRAQLLATLDIRASRLEDVGFFYFSGIPGGKVYADAELRRPIRLSKVLQDWAGAPMLVFGEAGAARPQSNSVAARLPAFLDQTKRAGLRPVVWINPMPDHRWQKDFVRALGHQGHACAFSLSHENLIAAINVMREQAK